MKTMSTTTTTTFTATEAEAEADQRTIAEREWMRKTFRDILEKSGLANVDQFAND